MTCLVPVRMLEICLLLGTLVTFILGNSIREIHRGGDIHTKHKLYGPATNIKSMTFLAGVNSTSKGCLAIAASPPIEPGLPHNKSRAFPIGTCDNGALSYTVDKGPDGMVITVIFHSPDTRATPPRCSMRWDGRYSLPDPAPSHQDGAHLPNVLPGCYTTTTHGMEGADETYYWFYLLTWELL